MTLTGLGGGGGGRGAQGRDPTTRNVSAASGTVTYAAPASALGGWVACPERPSIYILCVRGRPCRAASRTHGGCEDERLGLVEWAVGVLAEDDVFGLGGGVHRHHGVTGEWRGVDVPGHAGAVAATPQREGSSHAMGGQGTSIYSHAPRPTIRALYLACRAKCTCAGRPSADIYRPMHATPHIQLYVQL
jgi:hypothetical protein